MDEVTSGIDPDELMDLEEAEASDLDDDDEDVIDYSLPSPVQIPSSGPGSTATSTASSPPNNEDVPPNFNFTGKPLNIKRGRGRPRREGGKPLPKKQGLGARIKKWKAPGYVRGMPKRLKSFDRGDLEFSSITPSPSDDMSMLDPETGALILSDRDRLMPAPEELPYSPEHWPGKVCAFCNLGERSQLGQGDLLRLICPEGFIPQRIITEPIETLQQSDQTPERDAGDKSPRGPVTCRRQKSFNKCRHPSMTSEYVDELTMIGYVEEPEVQTLFEPTGHFYVHRNCAAWSQGVSRTEHSGLDNVGPAVLHSSSKKCSSCNRYGASMPCKMDGCARIYHFPCGTASGAFQEVTTLTMYCSQHLAHVPLACEGSVCYTCKILGDIANLMFCSVCGEHYHGTCVGLAQLPGVRAGWQCRRCRTCQVCRTLGDETKLMACEQCDKVYHAMCQRPVVTSIPKYGWKCRCCRICGDCGSRTPGAGLSSRWHAHYTVCDSCYQQRNKGFSCPLCHRAYRAHAHREMVQCGLCRKFVHGTCDPEADLTTYHQRKESNPEYEYVCLICKNLTQPSRQVLSKRNSTEDGDSMSASQDSLYDEYEYDFERNNEDCVKIIGLGRGKPYSASKIAKKRLGLGMPGRPKGVGKAMPGKVGFMKKQRMTEFGRKRGPKAKMRGLFGVPGVGLQRPVSDGSKIDDEPGVENRLVLCSAKDKFVLTQDICVMCGALGTDQEGCLISCVQCGQCYHPYCAPIKVTKLILQKGWRCLDCSICEGCGQRHDEGRLILCDDCDISYHIYCMDPPLDYVPHGNWKCKRCVVCQTCGATDPGFNCNWMNSFSECGPCASQVNCPSCLDPYNDGDLIIQCVQCQRWLHGMCDSIKTEMDAEKCAEEGYNCVLCRPRDVKPPHLLPTQNTKPPTPTKSPEVKSNTNYFVDGVCLSELGHAMIKSLSMEQQITRKKRKRLATIQDKEAGIMATIESVIAGGSADTILGDNAKLELVDVKDESQELYKEGMNWTKEDGPPPEGFTIYTVESGISVLRRKRQRNLQKLGIGGFLVRVRGIRGGQDTDDVDMLPGQTTPTLDPPSTPMLSETDKPRRKPIRRKIKSKLAETFPPYLQEAFFGKELMDANKEVDSSSGTEEEDLKTSVDKDRDKTIHLSQDEIKAVAAVSAKNDKQILPSTNQQKIIEKNKAPLIPKEEEESDTEALKDMLALPGDLLDTDLVNTIMNEDDDELTKNADTLESLTDPNLPDDSDITDTLGSTSNTKDTKDELSDILGSHFNLDSIPNINSKDVEDIFKGVLTDESQESQESNLFPISNSNVFGNNSTPLPPSQQPQQQQPQPIAHPVTAAVRPTTLSTLTQNNINSPVSFPPPSPYHSEYSNSPQFSPAFSEPPSPWVNVNDPGELDNSSSVVPSTYNQRSSEKMKADEGLGSGATISAVLYANMNHSEWKTEYPSWSDRYKQIIKKWRTLTTDQKAPYLQQAKDNRSALRMKKQQQISKESASAPAVPKTTPATVTNAPPSIQTSVASAAVSEVCTHHSRPSPSLTNASTSSVSVSPCSTPQPVSVPSSPPTQHQFTVHGHFLGPGDHCGPAPNVTVNPLYQPHSEQGHTPPPPPRPSVPPPAADQQIRVLTPSEIMRTLPSLCQETYEPQPLDQEKVAQQQKSAREAEQERQWKQLQALRQQQAQQQQHVIHEQRVQVAMYENAVPSDLENLEKPAIARVQRQMSETSQPFAQETAGVVQVTTSQELSPIASSSPNNRQFQNMGIKSPSFSHPSMGPRLATPSQPSQEFAQSPSSTNIDFQRITETNDPFLQSPSTPKPQIIPTNAPSAIQAFQPRLSADPYAHQPPTPRPQFTTPRPALQGFPQGVRPGEAPEINRQLRDLLQRQQFKKLDEQLLPGKGQQRVWPPNEGVQESEQVDGTFRQPLPPGIIRQRGPLPVGGVIRQPLGMTSMRMQPTDPRIQGIDPRMRLLIQQQQQHRALVPGNIQHFPKLHQTAVRPSVEQYEQLLQRQVQFQSRQPEQMGNIRLPVSQTLISQKAVVQQTLSVTPQQTLDSSSTEQEIPDNVTAELEKLEQEGSMVELQGVGDILGLADDDDELLAEMGADFNILEYADPELDALTGGEKTNILDSLDLVEPEPDKEEKKEKTIIPKPVVQQPMPTGLKIKTEPHPVQSIKNIVTSSPALPTQPPPLSVSQASTSLQHPQAQIATQSHHSMHHQVYQQMLAQVQQAAALGRPMATGTKLMSPEGIIGIVTPNNNITLTFPANYQQRFSHVQTQKLQMRLSGLTQNPRLLNIGGSAAPTLQGNPVSLGTPPRMNVAVPPPPPPPYPGPPPPYPGSAAQQMGLRMGSAPMGHLRLPMGFMHPVRPQGLPVLPHVQQRRPLLLEEQPLLLEELLEQEKREQEKQLQNQPSTTQSQEISSSSSTSTSALLSDHDFERLKADVFSSGPLGIVSNTQQAVPAQGLLPVSNSSRPSFQTPVATAIPNQWQNPPRPSSVQPQTPTEVTPRVPTFNANLLPAPPLPPEHIVTDQDKQTQLVYEQWLNHQNTALTQQLKYYETEVQKLRKMRKSLNSKQRQLKKTGNSLMEADALELQRISAEQAILQKHLESSRKQSRQHGMLIQEYRNKQQNKQRPGPGQSPLLMGQQTQSPLGPPSSSPIHPGNTPQSPMMSPSASPMAQHNSPLHSPSPLISHSPGPGSVSSVLQSPNTQTGASMSPMQPSPRIGTPLSQEGSPGPVQSPSQICLPPPAPRMTSPQHRRLVTSPVAYLGDRSAVSQVHGQPRFARPTNIEVAAALQQRTRLQSPSPNFQQKPGTPSPLNSPPQQQMSLTQQQLIQRHLQQQAFLQQNSDSQQNEQTTLLHSQRAMQLIQHRQLLLRQQHLSQQNAASSQPQPLTPQQHQLMVQQQQQLAKQQQLQIAQLQAQNQVSRLSQPPSSPMPPQSPHMNQTQQIMSPHSLSNQPASPMPPRSPMVSFASQPPSSPMPRSPAVHQTGNQPPSSPMSHHQYQPPNSPMPRSPMINPIQSPMSIRRPPSSSSSPANPDRPRSVENPGTPRTCYTTQTSVEHTMPDNESGGGNPLHSGSCIPVPPGFGRYGYFKLGLRGGAPMWNMGRGVKRTSVNTETKDDKSGTCSETMPHKFKKESHLSKVSILKKKSPIKSNLQSLAVNRVSSLVSADYNEFDDNSSTPPVTPPPGSSTSSRVSQRTSGKKLPGGEHSEQKDAILIDNNPIQGKQLRVEEIMDYDDDNNVVSTEVSLSSVAQTDGDDITVIQTFSQSDLADEISSPSGQIGEEFLLFPVISDGAQYSDKEEEEEEYTEELVDMNDKNMHIVNVAIQSPTTSEEELIMQGKTKKVTTDGLTLNIVQGLAPNHLLSVADAPESPEQEELAVDQIESNDEDLITNFDDSQIVIIDSAVKSPEEQISTKEDFEELIDEGTRKEKLKADILNTNKHINEIHKYAANVFSYPPKTITTTSFPNNVRTSNVIKVKPSTNLTGAQKISLIAGSIIPNTSVSTCISSLKKDVVIASSQKLSYSTASSNLSNIILPMKTTMRSNIINMPKLVTSASPAITIVNASTSHITSILPSRFTGPVLSASVVSKLPNVKVMDKPSTSLSLTTHDTLPKKIFEDDSVSPDSSNCEDEKSKQDSPEIKQESPVELKFPEVSNNNKIELNKNSKLTTEHRNLQMKVVAKLEESENSDQISNVESNNATNETIRKTENVQFSNMVSKEQMSGNSSSPLILHNPPELKMTAQVIQETPTSVQISQRTIEAMSASFITTQNVDNDGNSNDLDNKSVVISIPSPTPSQEQMLDNIALQALENRRRDGKGLPGDFESFDDVLDMIENITAEPSNMLENNIKDKFVMEEEKIDTSKVNDKKEQAEKVDTIKTAQKKIEAQAPVTITTTGRSAALPQLSPLSQPTELTTNISNVSQQLRTLLSSLHTTTVTTSSNVETVAKSTTHKEKTISSISMATTAVVTPKIVQQTSISNAGTVIVPNIKSKTLMSNSSPTNSSRTQSPVSAVQSSSTNITNITNIVSSSNFTSAILQGRSVGGIQLMPDHPKLPPVTTVSAVNNQINHAITSAFATVQKSVSVLSTNQSQPLRKTLSLNAMLQSHPAATKPQTSPTTITTASILGSPISITKTGFSASMAQAQPHVVSPLTNVNATTQGVVSSPILNAMITSTQTTITRPIVSTTNLLHSQLTKSVIRSRSLEESSFVTGDMIKKEDIKTELMDVSADAITTSNILMKQEMSACKYSSTQTSNKLEDSQNVLLKQLLQNTACAQQSQPSTPTTSSTSGPSLPLIPNLEAQLARPVPPTPTSLLPPILQNDSHNQQKNLIQRTPIMSRETSFVSKPVQLQQQQQQLPSTPPATSQQLHIDIKKCMRPSRTPSRDDLLSPPTPKSTCSQDSSLQTPPLTIKKEVSIPPQQSPLLTTQEMKKELIDESSQHSEISDHSRSDVQTKEEMMDLDTNTEKMLLDQKEELKKMKRRQYQQKRRQLNNKEIAGQPKKRPRKSSKVDEDYDSYIESLLAQMRTLPAMTVSEPILNKNYNVVNIFGAGELLKVGSREYNSLSGDLVGGYGNAIIPGQSDYYVTKPYGHSNPIPEKPSVSTQRGFYDQEFPLIKFDVDDDKKFEIFFRDDTPDSLISSSSPECSLLETDKFPGLRLIDEDEDDEEICSNIRMSPVVPIIAPIPIRLQPTGPYLKDYAEMDKENVGRDLMNVKTKFASTPTVPLKDSGNVTVTLTLTSSVAEDIMGVLRDLANILHIPAPTSYQIVERTSTPPSQKLGLYRTKGKDGKEGAPIDIQILLNGAAKFCRHCDVVILNNMIRKKISELPFLSKDTELIGDGDELYFCSTTCYMQFALMHRSPSLSEDKAAAIVDHLCQKDKADFQRKKQTLERIKKRSVMLNFDKQIEEKVERLEIKQEIKQEDIQFDMNCTLALPDFQKPKNLSNEILPSTAKLLKGSKYKRWSLNCLQSLTKYKKMSDKETMEWLYRMGITVTPSKIPDDTRKCMFCQSVGDGVADGPARLLNFDVDKWVHLNCGLWSDGVYETVNGALMNLENALQQSLVSSCVLCNRIGATIRCFKTRCSNIYHLSCAVKDGCVFYKNKTIYCAVHVLKAEKDNELTTLSVSRKVYVNRDENRQVAAVMHHSDQNNLLRVGSLIFLNVGQLLPHQLQNFHTSNYIYPIGYKIIRFYWSMRRLNKRCRYVCSIHEVSGRPEFRILVQETTEEDLELRDITPKAVWNHILEPLAVLRRNNQCIQIFPKYITGEDLFGLTEPSVVRVLESLPGIETLTDYKFKYGRNPLLELPLAINPSGAARTEPRLRNQLHWKRPHTQRTGSSARPVFAPATAGTGEAACPYSKQFVHSKSSQYKKMKQEWRNNVFLARSKIQGLGLYAARDLEKHTMVIEYIGEIIRTELAETREKKYEARNRGIYMFRLDEERVVDATLSGGLARYINHSCNPNCVAEIVEVDRDLRIIIFAKRRIQRGEELAYDYKFDIEDDQHKISCMCGAPNCRKWMN